MKKNNPKITLNKLKIAKLSTSLSVIEGGGGGTGNNTELRTFHLSGCTKDGPYFGG